MAEQERRDRRGGAGVEAWPLKQHLKRRRARSARARKIGCVLRRLSDGGESGCLHGRSFGEHSENVESAVGKGLLKFACGPSDIGESDAPRERSESCERGKIGESGVLEGGFGRALGEGDKGAEAQGRLCF